MEVHPESATHPCMDQTNCQLSSCSTVSTLVRQVHPSRCERRCWFLNLRRQKKRRPLQSSLLTRYRLLVRLCAPPNNHVVLETFDSVRRCFVDHYPLSPTQALSGGTSIYVLSLLQLSNTQFKWTGQICTLHPISTLQYYSCSCFCFNSWRSKSANAPFR